MKTCCSKLAAALLATISLLHHVESLTAATGSVTFTGAIEQVRVYGTPVWDSSVIVGAPYTATFLYDTTAPDFDPSNTGGAYRFMSMSAATLTFGNYSFSRDLSFVAILDNDPLYGDGLQFYSLGDPANSLGLFNVTMFQNCFQTPANTFSSDAVENVTLLPGILPTCGDRYGGFRAAYDGDNGFTEVFFMASSVEVVPEPRTTALVILGFLAAAWARSTRRRT